MPRRKASDQLEAVRQSQADSAAKLKDAAAVGRENRKAQEQRRHEIAGRVALAYADVNPDSSFTRTLAEQLNISLTKYSERAFFPMLTLALGAPEPIPKPLPKKPAKAERASRATFR